MYPSSLRLRRERTILRFLIATETFFAVLVLLMRFAKWYDYTFYHNDGRPAFSPMSFWEGICIELTSKYTMLPTLFGFFPLACLILLATLSIFQIRNRKSRVTGFWSIAFLLIGSLIPVNVWSYYSSFPIFYPIVTVMEWWVCLSIPVTHIFLYRDLHRYSKAIRACQAGESTVQQT